MKKNIFIILLSMLLILPIMVSAAPRFIIIPAVQPTLEGNVALWSNGSLVVGTLLEDPYGNLKVNGTLNTTNNIYENNSRVCTADNGICAATPYANGTGLTLTGTTFSIYTPYLNTLYTTLTQYSNLYNNVTTLQSRADTINTTATNALPKSGGTMTGNITIGTYYTHYGTGSYRYYNGSCLFDITPTANQTIGC